MVIVVLSILKIFTMHFSKINQTYYFIYFIILLLLMNEINLH